MFKTDSKKSQICPIWCQSAGLEVKCDIIDARNCTTSSTSLTLVGSGMSNLASKLGQISSKWDESGTF